MAKQRLFAPRPSELTNLGNKVLIIDLDPQANTSLHIGIQHPSKLFDWQNYWWAIFRLLADTLQRRNEL